MAHHTHRTETAFTRYGSASLKMTQKLHFLFWSEV